ncbi:single-strand DNA-binding protein [Mucilaginibacter sp. UYNi724]
MLSNSGINKVLLFGEITGDPFLNKTDKNQNYLCVTIVTKEAIKKGGDLAEHQEFHKIKIAEKLVNQEDLQLQEGQTIYVEGRIHTTAVFDERNIKRYNLEVFASKIEVIRFITAPAIA